ncbi:MAG: DUF6531 domain-containing protein, partial [Candidatus Dormibacteria bacterium]
MAQPESSPYRSWFARIQHRLLCSVALAGLLLAVTPSMRLDLALASGSQTPPTDPLPQSASYGGFNPVIPNLGVCSAADPVVCSDGDFYQTYSLLGVPGRGIPLGFSITYNSALAAQGSDIGYGWISSYGMTLTQSGSSVTITSANGSAITFTQSGSTYAAPSWAQASLTQNGGGTWTYVDENDHTTYGFSSTGVLDSESD